MHEDELKQGFHLRGYPWRKRECFGWCKHVPFVLIDLLLFSKWDCFQNRVSSKINLLRALLTSVVLGLMFLCVLMLFKILFCIASQYFPLSDASTLEAKWAAVTFFGLVGGLYWNFDHQYKSRWKYACDLFNKAEELACRANKADAFASQLFHAYLAIDLLQMDFWSQKLFVKTFQDEMGKAVERITETRNAWEQFLGKLPKDTQLDRYHPYETSKKYLINKANAGELHVEDARRILSCGIEVLQEKRRPETI